MKKPSPKQYLSRFVDPEELDRVTIWEDAQVIGNPGLDIQTAFVWEQSPQGWEFWFSQSRRLREAIYVYSYDGDVIEARRYNGDRVPVVQINGWLLAEGECPVCKYELEEKDYEINECPRCAVDFNHLTVEEVYFCTEKSCSP